MILNIIRILILILITTIFDCNASTKELTVVQKKIENAITYNCVPIFQQELIQDMPSYHLKPKKFNQEDYNQFFAVKAEYPQEWEEYKKRFSILSYCENKMNEESSSSKSNNKITANKTKKFIPKVKKSGEKVRWEEKKHLLGPVPAGEYYNVYITSNSFGVIADNETIIRDSIIEAPVCVLSSGIGTKIIDSTLDCELCIDFRGNYLYFNVFYNNSCTGQGTNRPDIFGW